MAKRRRLYQPKFLEVPLIKEDQKISLAFLEVGCKQKRKKAQLKFSKDNFRRFWEQHYKKLANVDWHPSIYRMVAHYQDYNAWNRPDKYQVDTIIRCDYITKERISQFDERDKRQLYSIVNKKKCSQKKQLKEIITEGDSDDILELIVNGTGDCTISHLRGRIAEMIIQKSVLAAKPKNMWMYNNGFIKAFHENYPQGIEIDSIMVFYGKSPYNKLVDNLKKQENLTIENKV